MEQGRLCLLFSGEQAKRNRPVPCFDLDPMCLSARMALFLIFCSSPSWARHVSVVCRPEAWNGARSMGAAGEWMGPVSFSLVRTTSGRLCLCQCVRVCVCACVRMRGCGCLC